MPVFQVSPLRSEGLLRLGDGWKVTLEEILLEELRHRFGAEAVRVEY